MRDEDEVFAEIVKEEFNEQWVRPDPPAADQHQPLPDFHLNLYDDEESYRQIPRNSSHLSVLTDCGLGLLGLGLVITILRIAPLGLPAWLGWVAVGCFVVGVCLCLWRLTHRHDADQSDDDDGVL